MNNFIDKIPETLEKSTDVFSLFALITIVITVLGFLFYAKADKKDKNRAFVLILLFLVGVVLAALFSGIKIGSENTVNIIEQNPSSVNPQLVKLPIETIEKLENYITAQNKNPSEENKVAVLKEALANYINSEQNASLNTTTSLERPTNREFVPTISWRDTTSTLDIYKRLDQDFPYLCPSGGTIETVYGTDIYNNTTSICTAAVHSGIITARVGGKVTIRIRPKEESYSGTYRNEVESKNTGRASGSFIFLQ